METSLSYRYLQKIIPGAKSKSFLLKLALFSVLVFSKDVPSPRNFIANFKTFGSSNSNACNSLDGKIKGLYESGDYEEALNLCFVRLDSLDVHDTIGFIDVYSNMGGLYTSLDNNKEALIYYEKSITLAQNIHDNLSILGNLNDLSGIYFNQGNYPQALASLQKALDIISTISYENDPIFSYVIGHVYRSLVIYYLEQQDIQKAEEYLAFITPDSPLFASLMDKRKAFFRLYSSFLQARVLSLKGQYHKALDILTPALNAAYALEDVESQQEILKAMDNAYVGIGDYENAHKTLAIYESLRYELIGVERQKMEVKKRTLEKEKQLVIQQSEITLQKERIKRNKLYFAFGTAIMASLLAFLLVLKRKNTIIHKEKEEVEKQKAIVEEQKKTVEEQKAVVESQKKDIDDSIDYASRTQRGMLNPYRESFKKAFPESFIIWKPRDKVSGDFYWMKEVGQKKYLAFADCTGHGVPGAFLSMYGFGLMNDVIKTEQDPAKILGYVQSELQRNIMHSDGSSSSRRFGKEDIISERDVLSSSTEGMDLAILCMEDTLNEGNKAIKVTFAGKFQPFLIYHPSRGQGSTASVERMAMTGSFSEDQELFLKEGDILYAYSDGLVDQMGGEEESPKAKIKKAKTIFERKIQEFGCLPLAEQEGAFLEFFEKWRMNRGMKQMDDVTLAAIKIVFNPDEDEENDD